MRSDIRTWLLPGAAMVAAAALYIPKGIVPQAASRFRLEPVTADRTDDYLATAPVTASVYAELPMPPMEVFDALLDESCFSWLPGVSGFRYDSSHRGLGATRVLLNPLMAVREQFTAYREGERLDYTFIGMSIPALVSAVESYELQPVAQGSTLLTVRVAMTPRIPVPRMIARPLHRSFTVQAVRGLGGAKVAGGEARTC
ncbi:SRPBCC family protein [Nocardia sp. NPDC058058]|uniref:SRPBCC family protein n=1 Tax=Nocardia sp. NPDC058058 TaxID=3346317 RepID=UPI0036DD8497